MAACIFLRTSSLVTKFLYEMFSSLWWPLISKVCFLLSSFAINVHASQAYRNIEMTRERIRFTFESRDMLLSLHICFSFVRAAVAREIVERTSEFESSSEIIGTRNLKLVTVPSFRPLTLISLWIPLALFVIGFVFSALTSISYLVQVFVEDFQLRLLVPALLQQAQQCHRQTQIGNSSAAYANL